MGFAKIFSAITPSTPGLCYSDIENLLS